MIARLCYDTILEYGLLAKQSCEANVVTPALEHVVEANSLLSSVGFESGGLGAAHGIENGLGIVKEAEEYLHGELVAVGFGYRFAGNGSGLVSREASVVGTDVVDGDL